MSTADPIRDMKELEKFRNYYKEVEPDRRNYLLVVTSLNTALRISDVLELRWSDLYDFTNRKVRGHIFLHEKKTGKTQVIAINRNLRSAVVHTIKISPQPHPDEYIFTGYGCGPMNRSTAYRIIRKAARSTGVEGNISCHSLRKTFGYHAWKKGASPALLMSIYNHSSYQITKRYLGIEQDDKDTVFMKNNL